MEPSRSKLVLIVLSAVTAAACGKKQDDATAKGTGSAAPAAPTTAPPPSPSPTSPPPPPPAAADPYAQGFCEYTVDGGAPNKGGGGLSNVMSLHWMAPEQQGRGLASLLLVNCGTGAQVNLMSGSDAKPADVPMAAGKYPIDTSNQPATFAVLGKDFMGGKGELEITAWDNAHVAGTFTFTAGGKTYAGRFDLKCPYPGNGVCR